MYTEMTPKEIVNELNKYIVGQDKAKKVVAIALRNRWRRMKVDKIIRNEIYPKNILMIGPTGVGKTEIARRLAKMSCSPFIKVEATKFTEVGYVGKEVDSIIRDLVDYAIKMIRIDVIHKGKKIAKKLAENRILDILINKKKYLKLDKKDLIKKKIELKKKLCDGLLDNDKIEINISMSSFMGIEIISPPGMEEMINQIQSIFHRLSSKRKKKSILKIKDAINILIDEESSNLINFDDLKKKAINLVEQQGIVFIDEIDKICKRGEFSDSGISREGVQRDLLPLIEGCSISTKYGFVKTDNILFIASGSFHFCSPSDLIPELQGRLPIRVKLKELNSKDFEKILIKTNFSITLQYIELLKTENVNIIFTKDGIKSIAEISFKVNEKTENIGARRLYTILEKLMEDISFNSNEYYGKSIIIDSKYVLNKLKNLYLNQNLNRYIL